MAVLKSKLVSLIGELQDQRNVRVSLADIESATGISQSTLSRLSNRPIKRIEVETIEAIARFFGKTEIGDVLYLDWSEDEPVAPDPYPDET